MVDNKELESRKYPEVLDSYTDGSLVLELKPGTSFGAVWAASSRKAAVLALPRSRLAKEAESSRSARTRAA